MVGGAVIEAGGSDGAPAKPKARGKKSTATPMSTKKRKVRAMTTYEEEGEDEDVKQED